MNTETEVRDKILVVVMAGGEGRRLLPLTKTRTKPAVPIGTKYRLIDIVLSNAANSGLLKSFVLVQGKDKSLNSHIKNSWYSSQQFNAFTEIISPQGIGKAYKGDADAVRQIVKDIKNVRPSLVLIAPGDQLLKMNYYNFVKFLAETNADAAISIIKRPMEQASQLGSVQVDNNDYITGFKEKDPNTPFAFNDENGQKAFFASMGIYAFKEKVLYKALKLQGNLFGKDIIPQMLPTMKIVGYNYNKHNIIIDKNLIYYNDMVFEDFEKSTDSDYWRDVGTIEEYFHANMDLAGITPLFNLYGEKWPFYTSRRYLGPAKIIMTQPGGIIESAIIGEGSILSNVKGRSLVVSQDVYIEKSELENVIIFEGTNIQKCSIKNTIIDKRVRLMSMTIGFDEEEDRRRGFYIDPKTKIRVIPKEYDYAYNFKGEPPQGETEE